MRRSRTWRRLRRRWRRASPGQRLVASAVVAAALAAVMAGHHTAPAGGPARTTAAAGTVSGAPSPVAARAIAYARQQIGKPYLWGGTGPDAYDCSGLVMEAYASAGVPIPRTSETQWAAGPQVPPDQVEPGDLVFFAGGDGTVTAPGHVGLVIGGGQMIEAYATGYAIRISVYGQASSPPGDQDPVGFTDPAAGGS